MIRLGLFLTLVAIAAAVPALAAVRKAPSRATVTAVDRADLPPNRDLKQTDDLRWLPASTRIKSGGRLTLRNLTRGQAPGILNEVHNFSIVRSSQIPRTELEALTCGNSGVCRALNEKHRLDPNTGQPTIAVVNRGRRGIDRTGDSIAFYGTRRARVTARPGKTLRFICAIHPHMQGKIVVGR